MVGRVDAIVRTKPGGHQASPRAVGGKGGCGRAEENEVQPPRMIGRTKESERWKEVCQYTARART